MSKTEHKIILELSDAYNAQYFAKHYHNKIAWCKDLGGWFSYDGKKWVCDGSEGVSSHVFEMAEYMRADFKSRGLLGGMYEKHCNKMLSTAGWKSTFESAKSYVQIKPEEFDNNLYLVNCLNGTYDLENDLFKEFNPDDKITKTAGVIYDKNATCEKWEKFLKEIFLDDLELIAYIQRVVGYSLTASTKEHAMFIFYGTGRNGKSLFLETISEVIKDYSINCPSSMLIQKQNHGINNDVARLKGTRFATASETSQNINLDEELIKQLTGNKLITARFLNKEFFDFEATFKIFLATNHKPNIRGTDTGIWSKIQMIPFNLTLKEEEQDKDLGKKLLTESSGIFNWIIEGYRQWRDKGLSVPNKVKRATQLYREEEDDIGRFIKDECIDEKGAFIPTSEFKNRFFLNMGYHKGQKIISEYMERHGYKPHGDNKVYYQGKQQRGYVNIRWANESDRVQDIGWSN